MGNLNAHGFDQCMPPVCAEDIDITVNSMICTDDQEISKILKSIKLELNENYEVLNMNHEWLHNFNSQYEKELNGENNEDSEIDFILQDISTSSWQAAKNSGILNSVDYELLKEITYIYQWLEKDFGFEILRVFCTYQSPFSQSILLTIYS